MRRIHIIAGCANKKREPPVVLLRDIPGGSVEERAKCWSARLRDVADCASEEELLTARELYIGNYWSIVKELQKQTDAREIETRLWVISAGYGLVSDSDFLLPYSATFTKDDADSVTTNTANPSDACSTWWKTLTSRSENANSLARLFRDHKSDHFLVVASSDYITAIQSDLVNGLNHLEDPSSLVVISSKTSATPGGLKPHLIPTDARLICNPMCPAVCGVHYLGRNLRGSIGAALARQFLRDVVRNGFSADRFKTEIDDALAKSPNLFTHQRIAMSDSDVRSYIDREIGINKSTSATKLLRKLRGDGYACEQKRFKHLFRQVVEEAS
jgi:hypothetical protein